MTTAVVMTGSVAVVAVMAIWGIRAATAPIKTDSAPPASASTGPTCSPADQTVSRYVRRADVTVSVYNAGKRSGRAQATLDLLQQAGFKPGAIGNAVAGTVVPRAEVRTTAQGDVSARLVAEALGPNTKVVVVTDTYGPGVDVFIGDRFNRLDRNAPAKIKLPTPIVTCK